MTPIRDYTQRGDPFGLYLSPPYNRGSHTPLYPSYGGPPLPYPPSPWGVFGVKRGFNTINEICMGILKKMFIKIFGKIWYLLV